MPRRQDGHERACRKNPVRDPDFGQVHHRVPAVIAGAGEHAARRFLEFFAATIRNKNTRMAYYRAACHFFASVERHRPRMAMSLQLFRQAKAVLATRPIYHSSTHSRSR
jgi:hypothetical protein